MFILQKIIRRRLGLRPLRRIGDLHESEGVSDSWDSDCSTDTECLIERIEREVHASPMLIGGRIMTVEENETVEGSSTSRPNGNITPNLDRNISTKNCASPPRRRAPYRGSNYVKPSYQSQKLHCRRPHMKEAHQMKHL